MQLVLCIWLFNSGMGVDVKINQADLIGHMIAGEMNYQSIMTLMRLSKGHTRWYGCM